MAKKKKNSKVKKATKKKTSKKKYIASFAKKKFKVNANYQYTFSGLSRTSSLSTEEKANGKGKVSTKIKSIGADDFSIEMVLRNTSVDVLKEVNSWKKLMNKKKSYYFMLGSRKYVPNKCIISNVDDSDYIIGLNGIVRQCKLKISFKEARKATKKKKKKNSKKKSTKKRTNKK